MLFLITGIRVLLRNYRYGPPELQEVNTFLLAIFLTRVVMFIVIFGAFATEFHMFTGIIGLSVTLNRGSCGPDGEPDVSARSALAV